ncbi:MAG: putative mitochondrial 2-oxoglutarate/malate carrier protein [Trizodia sp. TS-e1964]|nr:MAG: putative mitochondrial 2-oxoglutarate/malate carrier protein [Trizodia sp. TS-e1964]
MYPLANTKRSNFTRAVLPFCNGGFAGIVATCIIQPVDFLKVRMQLAGEGAKAARPSAFEITKQIVAQGKLLDMYSGLSAGLLRQSIYTTARMGLFDTFKKTIASRAAGKGEFEILLETSVAAASAGGIAAIFGNPADLALIRMQSDGLKPVNQRANYSSVIDAVSRITRSEGPRALFNGAYPSIVRAMALNFGQLACSDVAKRHLKANTNMSAYEQILASAVVGGFFASFFSLPFDFVKTRLQKQQKGPDGVLPYKGMINCFQKVAKQEGVFRFYRGFGTYLVRISPHAIITLLVVDALKSFQK